MSDTKTGNEVDVENKTELQPPRDYAVILHNDDFTPMEFVIKILAEIFNKNFNEAYEIMMKVHTENKGIAGIYNQEIAETKAHELKK